MGIVENIPNNSHQNSKVAKSIGIIPGIATLLKLRYYSKRNAGIMGLELTTNAIFLFNIAIAKHFSTKTIDFRSNF